MGDRYFGKVVETLDQDKIVMNKGGKDGVEVGQKFVVVSLGDVVVDPDTNEELERLEIVRGHIAVAHVQPKMATLESYEYQQEEETRMIKKMASKNLLLYSLYPQETVTESIPPSKKRLKALEDVEIGDYMIRI